MKCPCCGSELKCPCCGAVLQKGIVNIYCSNYKAGCRFNVPYLVCGKKLTENQIIMLITQQRTNLIKGMTSKNGKKFDAALIIHKKTGKLSFELPGETK